MQTKNLPTNEVPTTTQENLAVAKMQETFPKACAKFRQLEYANKRGTGEHQFNLLEEHFNKKESLY
tara:strand:- start:83 stop:280 length:198 start_codon:yes stop_codon:yes gene_type:complete